MYHKEPLFTCEFLSFRLVVKPMVIYICVKKCPCTFASLVHLQLFAATVGDNNRVCPVSDFCWMCTYMFKLN